MRLPDETTTTFQMFADDTALFLQATLENPNRTLSILNTFTDASGGKLNCNKSVAINIRHTERNWGWTEDPGFKWLRRGQTTTYLGFPFGFRIPPEEISNKVQLMVKNGLTTWSAKRLSLAGRILISNQVILAMTWYLCSCAYVANSAFTKHLLKITSGEPNLRRLHEPKWHGRFSSKR